MSTQPPSNEQKGSKNTPPKQGNVNKDDLLDYFKTHIRESISYVLLIIGLAMLFFQSYSLYGGLLVGIVAGVYFGDQLVSYIKSLKNTFDNITKSPDVARHLITLGIALAVFIAVPGLFIGAAVAIAIRLLFVG